MPKNMIYIHNMTSRLLGDRNAGNCAYYTFFYIAFFCFLFSRIGITSFIILFKEMFYITYLMYLPNMGITSTHRNSIARNSKLAVLWYFTGEKKTFTSV